MDRNFLQLRGQGCQGVWSVFQSSRILMDTACGDTASDCGQSLRLALFLTPAEAWQRPFWEATARRVNAALVEASGESALALSFAPANEFAGESAARIKDGITAFLAEHKADMAIVGGMEHDALESLAATLGMPVINAGNNSARPCQVLADMLALVRRLGSAADDIGSVRVSWMGGADGENAGYVNSWLDLALCFQHELFLSFPQGREPDPDPLDFAMNAGAKIFLSYEPAMVTEGAHALVVAPWRQPDLGPGRGLAPRHPLAMDPSLAEAGVSVFSLTADVPVAEDLRIEREKCLVACQAALVEQLTKRD